MSDFETDNPFAAPVADLGPASAAYRESPELSALPPAANLTRLAAFTLDGLALILIYLAAGVAVAIDDVFINTKLPEPWESLVNSVVELVAVFLPVLYFTILESSFLQGTLGKRYMGLRVVNAHGERIGVFRSLLRQLGRALNYLLLMDTLILFFNPRRRALHDYIAGTYLVQGARREPRIRFW